MQKADSSHSDKSSKTSWTRADAENLYGFKRWGGGHFQVDEQGAVEVLPLVDNRSIRIVDVIEEARTMGLTPPLTIRFQDVLHHRVEQLNEAFNRAIEEEKYSGDYKGVFPIKVNQLREVVEEILVAGEPYDFGLEAGSKPELLIALAMHEKQETLIICNGYKDEDYIRLALMGRKLGKEIIIVVEQLSEIELIINLAKEAGVLPYVGMRVKISAAGEGKWATSSGEGAKFGLTAPEMIEAARLLKKAGLTKAVKLVHFHIGSQVPNILTIKRAVIEASRFYCELYKMGFPMGYIDVGGGLGIDYDGSRSNFESSANYSLNEYARDVVFNIKENCNASEVPLPNIVSESGRALTATHSLLVVEAVGRISKSHVEVKRSRGKRHQIVSDLEHILKHADRYGPLERYHDALQKKEEAYSLFNLGYLDLKTRAEAETLFWEICRDIRANRPVEGYEPDELAALDNKLAEQYVCNFSVFQSLIDHWACDQLFPIAPLHRLNEKPTVNATLVDITCDSEGKVSDFIDLEEDAQGFLPLHPLNDDPYYLGIFLAGAYQDIMGDLHNLFGRVSEVHVFLEDDEEDGFYIEETIKGSRVQDVLKFIQHDSRDLARSMKKQIDAATRHDKVKPREGVALQDFYEELLTGGTYLKPSVKPKKKRVRKK